jgi:hypothetical protein
MRVRKNIPTLRSTQAPELAAYHQGPILTNGALEFVYDKPVAWPVYTLWGIGIPTENQFASLQPEQLRSELALTQAPIYGAGVPAGYVEFMKLLEESGAGGE